MNAETTIVEDERAGLPSASGIERLISCRGSFQAEQGMPELPPQAVTQDGTDIHEALETGDTEGMDEPEAKIVERLQHLERSALDDWMAANFIESMPLRHAEERLWIRNRSNLELLASAKLDVFYVYENHCLIIDAKSGFKKATASDRNWQLLTQAIAVRHEFPHVTNFRVAIAASRLSSSLDIAEYTSVDIDAGEKELNHAIWLAKQPNPSRTPGSWCQYCRANGHCPQAAAFSSIVLTDRSTGIVNFTKLGILEAVQRMTPQQMASVYIKSKVATLIFASVADRLKTLPVAQLEALGLGMKPGAERRSVEQNKPAFEILLKELSSDELGDCLTLGVAKVQKALVKKKSIKEPAAKALVSELLGTLLITKQNAQSLEIK